MRKVEDEDEDEDGSEQVPRFWYVENSTVF